MLAEIRKDMKKTRIPSWVSRAPFMSGSSLNGKLTADQWRTLCTLNLVVTVGRLWGCAGEARERKNAMLENYMHLVTAVKMGLMRSLNPFRINQNHYNMHEYLHTLLELYPDAGISPYQHLSLHLPEMLRQWGPTHGWRSFPFERCLYLLQKIPTNRKFGRSIADI